MLLIRQPSNYSNTAVMNVLTTKDAIKKVVIENSSGILLKEPIQIQGARRRSRTLLSWLFGPPVLSK